MRVILVTWQQCFYTTLYCGPQTYDNIPQTTDQMRIAKVEQSSTGVAAFPTFGALPAAPCCHQSTSCQAGRASAELDKFGGASGKLYEGRVSLPVNAQSCVKILLLSFENHPQNVSLLNPKCTTPQDCSQPFLKPGGNVFP